MREAAKWNIQATIDKFDASDIMRRIRQGRIESSAVMRDTEGGLLVERSVLIAAGVMPYETVESVGNLLLTAGITRIWNLVAGSGATAFNAANSRIAVGDSTTAASAAQTDLQASSNKYYKLVSGAPSVSTNQTQYAATYGTSVANFQWNEWGIDNGTADSATTGVAPMMNRAVVGGSLGTKTSSASWSFTVTISLS